MRYIRSIRGVSGVMRQLSFRVFEKAFLTGSNPIDDRDPFIMHKRDPDTTTDLILKKAMSLAETGIPFKTMGLSLRDLMDLDMATFDQIDETVTRILKDKATAVEEFEDDLGK